MSMVDTQHTERVTLDVPSRLLDEIRSRADVLTGGDVGEMMLLMCVRETMPEFFEVAMAERLLRQTKEEPHAGDHRACA